MIYDKIKSLCEKQGRSIHSVEMACSLANGTIRKWNSYHPRAISLVKVAHELNVSVEELLEDVDS